MACMTKLSDFLSTVRKFHLAVAATFMLTLSTQQANAQDLGKSNLSEELQKSQPGDLINIGTHSVHIHCAGKGFPTVILEAGLGGLSLEWARVQKSLAAHTRVCAYDRSGYGWSEKSPRQRTTSNIADELNRLLTSAQIEGPYILVGHSFGGYTAQLFASRFPHKTAGLVLVDASHPGQVERFRKIGLNTVPVKRVTHVRYNTPRLPANLPVEVRRTVFQLIVEGETMPTAAAEFIDFYTSAKQVAAEIAIPDIPMMVLTRGVAGWKNNPRGKKYEQLWQNLQAELANMSPTSAHLWASKSGHHVHLDQPELTASAIMMVVERARINHQSEITPVDFLTHSDQLESDSLNWVALNDASWQRNGLLKRMFTWPVGVADRMYTAVQH